jgi:hypothetical protein
MINSPCVLAALSTSTKSVIVLVTAWSNYGAEPGESDKCLVLRTHRDIGTASNRSPVGNVVCESSIWFPLFVSPGFRELMAF